MRNSILNFPFHSNSINRRTKLSLLSICTQYCISYAFIPHPWCQFESMVKNFFLAVFCMYFFFIILPHTFHSISFSFSVILYQKLFFPQHITSTITAKYVIYLFSWGWWRMENEGMGWLLEKREEHLRWRFYEEENVI